MLRGGCTRTGPAFSTDYCSPAGQGHEVESWELAEPQNSHSGPSRDQLCYALGEEAHCKARVCPCKLKVSLNTLGPSEAGAVHPHGDELHPH